MFSTIELFAGAGGLALGVEKAGFNTIGLVEFDRDACDTLEKNRPNWRVICDDIANISKLNLEEYFGIKFYALVTGQEDAMYQMCMVLPSVIENVVNEGGDEVKIPHDTVINELKAVADQLEKSNENLAMAMAIYLLGFSSYLGFSDVAGDVTAEQDQDKMLKHIYEYAKRYENK